MKKKKYSTKDRVLETLPSGSLVMKDQQGNILRTPTMDDEKRAKIMSLYKKLQKGS